MGGIQLIKKTPHSTKLINLWSKITENYLLINDEITNNEYPEFIENRHDQSIYSMLVYKFGSIKLNDETSYFAENHKNPFPILARRLTH